MSKILVAAGMFGYAFCGVKYICIPLYEHLLEKIQSLETLRGIFIGIENIIGYDILSQRTLNMWLLCAFTAYISVCFLCASLDFILPFSFKSQGKRSYFSATEWYQAIRLSMFNLLFVSWVVTIPVGFIWKDNSLLPSENEPISLSIELMKYGTCALVVEVWFYCTHYALHTPWLYCNIHKIHHRFKAPVAAASVYAHPIEFIFGNLLGVVLGPILTKCHPMTSYIWVFNALSNTTGSAHSGFTILAGKAHDIHHQYFDYNYGVGTNELIMIVKIRRKIRKPLYQIMFNYLTFSP